MKSPITDKDLGIVINSDNKFADIRAKAHEDLEERYRKAKRDKTVKLPNHKIGEEVVVIVSHVTAERNYILVEVIDLYERLRWRNEFHYYGVVKKISGEALRYLLGHLIDFTEKGGYFSFESLNIMPGDIKWL